MSTSKSNTSQATTTQDNRQVVTNTTSSYDLSNRSTTDSNNSLWEQANSNNTTANANSNNTTTYYTTTDSGAVSGALGLAQQVVNQIAGVASTVTGAATQQAANAYDYSDGIFHSALDFADTTNSRSLTAYDRAAQIEENALDTVTKQSGAVIDQLQNAYADAKGTSESQQKIILGVLAVAGVFALSSMRR